MNRGPEDGGGGGGGGGKRVEVGLENNPPYPLPAHVPQPNIVTIVGEDGKPRPKAATIYVRKPVHRMPALGMLLYIVQSVLQSSHPPPSTQLRSKIGNLCLLIERCFP